VGGLLADSDVDCDVIITALLDNIQRTTGTKVAMSEISWRISTHVSKYRFTLKLVTAINIEMLEQLQNMAWLNPEGRHYTKLGLHRISTIALHFLYYFHSHKISLMLFIT
jgi:hypothetical protein